MSEESGSRPPDSPAAKLDLRDDAALLSRFRLGERAAVASVVRAYAPVAAAAIGAIERDPIEANDILQDTLIALVVKRHQYGGRGLYAAYVCMVARNKAYSALRKRKRTAPLEDEAADPAPSQEEVTIEAEEEHRRERALSDLNELRASMPEDLREVMDLHYVENMGRPRITRATGLTEKVVRRKMRVVDDLLAGLRARWASRGRRGGSRE